MPQEIKDAKGGHWYAAASYGDTWLIGGEELLLWQYGSYHRSRFMYGTIRCLCHWRNLWLGGTDSGELFSFSDGFQFQVQSTKEVAKPTQELLFLCDFGFLAEDAVQIAAQSGYYRAYNVGSVYRWNQKMLK